jgi:porin
MIPMFVALAAAPPPPWPIVPADPPADPVIVAAMKQAQQAEDAPPSIDSQVLAPAERTRWLPPLGPANSPRQAGTAAQLVTDPHLLGDWAGLRSKLSGIGVVPSVQYVGEGITNVSGGTKNQALYDDQLNLALSTDLKTLTGVIPGSFQVSINRRRGGNFNALSGINQLESAHEVYGRGQIWRLGQLWYRITLGAFELKSGRMPLSEDWSTARCDFESLYLCGGHNGHVSTGVWFNYPVSMWGTRLRYNLGKVGFVQAGAYAVNPKDIDTTRNFYAGWKGATGVTAPVEINLTPRLGGTLPGIYKIGLFYSNAPVSDPVLNSQGAIRALAGGSPLLRTHQVVWWFNMRQQLVVPRPDGSHGLALFFSSSLGDRAAATNRTIMGGGITYTGVLSGRPADEIAFGIGYGALNSRVTDAERVLNAAGRPTAMLTDETMLEAYYGIALRPGFVLRPDVQVGFHPGADHTRPTAYMTGFKTVITL